MVLAAETKRAVFPQNSLKAYRGVTTTHDCVEGIVSYRDACVYVLKIISSIFVEISL